MRYSCRASSDTTCKSLELTFDRDCVIGPIQFKFSTLLPQIIERSADGWWTGKIDGKVGVIPASFVEEITVPQSKEEAKKLVKKFKQGKLSVETHAESHPESLASELICTCINNLSVCTRQISMNACS